MRGVNMHHDMLDTQWFCDKVKSNGIYAQNLYCAICNNVFYFISKDGHLEQNQWSASWRFAGGIIAEIRREGDYMDWYCSGIGAFNEGNIPPGYVEEGVITEEIKQDLFTLGWASIKSD